MKADSRPVVVITGTSRGIGRYLATHYLEKGLSVVGCSRGAADLEGSNYQHFRVDVSDEAGVKGLFTEVRRSHGRLDILINNAGVPSSGHSMLTPGSTVRGVFDTNYLGTFLFCREAAKLMQANHDGRIVNFVSTTVPLKWEGAAVYASSKAAVLTLTQIMAREVADVGITVNAVAPPVISTELGRAVPEDKIHSLLDRHAIKRLGEFSDVANVVDFFIKPESALVTGQVIFLGGA